MNEEIRRRKTTDAEMDALVLMEQAFARLDTEAAKRILDWAQDRYVESPRRGIKQETMDALQAQIKGYTDYAERLGVTDRDLCHALSHVRSAKRLAPIDADPDPSATEDEAVKAAIRARS